MEYLTWRFKTMESRVFAMMLIFGPFAVGVVLFAWDSATPVRNVVELVLGVIVTGAWLVGPYLWHARPWRRKVGDSAAVPWR